MICFTFSSGCTPSRKALLYNEYAFYLVKTEHYKEALFYLLKADAEEDDYRIKNNIALCYEALGDHEKADAYYREGMRLKKTKTLKDNYEKLKQDHP